MRRARSRSARWTARLARWMRACGFARSGLRAPRRSQASLACAAVFIRRTIHWRCGLRWPWRSALASDVRRVATLVRCAPGRRRRSHDRARGIRFVEEPPVVQVTISQSARGGLPGVPKRALGQDAPASQPDALDIEMVGRLVEQQQIGRAHERARERDALAPATRQPVDGLIGARLHPGEAELRDELVDARVVLPRARRREEAGGDGGAHGRARLEHGRLRQIGDAQAARRETAPRSTPSSPARMRSSVDLPAPLGPMRPTRSPSASVKLTSSKSARAPKVCPRACADKRIATRRSVV